MKLRPKPGDRAVVPGTDELLRGNTYFLVQAAGPTPTAVEYSVTPR